MKTLLLVDIQYDFLPGGTLAVTHGEEVIPGGNLARSLISKACPRCFGRPIASKAAMAQSSRRT